VVQVAALPGQKFDGKVTRFASALDPSTRTMRVEIELANKEGRPFWPGMYANVTLYLDDAKGILTLPSKLVHKDGTQVFVWAAADGKARKLPVTVAADDGTTAEIKGGLRPDTVVVRPVQGTLKADQPVILPDKPTK
jgi:multidrug efflux pump subunit AcrA (membrane-fusion protein)